jgi:hypothetical protein
MIISVVQWQPPEVRPLLDLLSRNSITVADVQLRLGTDVAQVESAVSLKV